MEIKSFIKSKRIIPYLIAFLVLEIALIFMLKGSGARMTLVAGVTVIPVGLAIIYYMFSNFQNALLLSLFCIPLMPVLGYIMLRLDLLKYQWILYISFYIVSALALIRNKLISKINIKNIKTNNKYIKITLILLLVVNIVFAYNKLLSFMIIMLSFVPFITYMLIIKAIEPSERQKLMDKVLFSVSFGCLISSMPDLLFFFMNWMMGRRGIRGFGPFAGNYILVYDLIILVIALNKVVKYKSIKNKWNIILLGLLIVISTQVSRGAFFTFIAIMVAYIIFNFKNYKLYLPIFLIVTCLLGYNVMNRADVANDTSINEIKDILVNDKQHEELEEEQEIIENVEDKSNILIKLINTQSITRQAIWKATLNITYDYPYTGIGIGNLQYFFDDYTTGKKGYADAHNFMLNMSCELGVLFMALAMLLLIISGVVEFIKFFKEKNSNIKLNRLSFVIICGVIFAYGNLTGIALQLTNEVYSFVSTFILIFVLFYRDVIEEV